MFGPSKIPEELQTKLTIAARMGKKKAWITLNTKAQVAPVRKATQSLTGKDFSPIRDYPIIAITDKRLFVRPPQENE